MPIESNEPTPQPLNMPSAHAWLLAFDFEQVFEQFFAAIKDRRLKPAERDEICKTVGTDLMRMLKGKPQHPGPKKGYAAKTKTDAERLKNIADQIRFDDACHAFASALLYLLGREAERQEETPTTREQTRRWVNQHCRYAKRI